MLASSRGADLVPILTPIITLIALRALLSASKRAPVPTADGSIELRYGRGIVVLGAALLAFTFVLAAIGIVARPKDIGEGLALGGMMLFFGAAGLAFTAIGLRTRLDVSDTGLRLTGAWGRVRELAWREIVGVQYSTALGYLRVIGPNGYKLSVSPMMRGFVPLLDLLEKRLAPAIAADGVTKARTYLSRMNAAA
jgi:hypothetical protein